MRREGDRMSRFIFAVIAMGMGCSAYADSCKNGQRQLCPDLIGYDIQIHHVSAREIKKTCGSNQARACAKLDRNDFSCSVYLDENQPNANLIHELNHCHGWNHIGVNYSRSWVPMQGVDSIHVSED